MANPQAENGHVDISNEIMDALSRVILYPDEWRCLMTIIRKTWGWHKKEDWISLSQFVLSTGMRKPNVCRALSKLITKSMIIKVDNGNGLRYRFQKDFEQWKSLSKLITLSNQITGIIQADNDRYLLGDPQKKVLQKKVLQKKVLQKKKEFLPDSPPYLLASQLLQRILERKPDLRKPNLAAWAYHVSLMIRKDGRKPERIAEVIDFSQQDSFWSQNILSTDKLREKFDQLELKMNSPDRRIC
jgi:phage replication O-like protein O